MIILEDNIYIFLFLFIYLFRINYINYKVSHIHIFRKYLFSLYRFKKPFYNFSPRQCFLQPE